MGTIVAGQRLIEGAEQSAVRVVIYEDLQCPDCATFRKMLDEQLLPKYLDTVTFEHRDFPLAKHSWARKGAIVGRHFEQTKAGLGLAWRKYALEHLVAINSDNFITRVRDFAKDNGVDPDEAVASLADKTFADAVESDFQEGVARGIAHTPTIFVNGQPFIERFSFQEVAKTIDAELIAAKQ